MRQTQHAKTNNIVTELSRAGAKKRQHSGELVESLLNIRARLEDYLSLVNHNQERLDSRPRPKQMNPSVVVNEEILSDFSTTRDREDLKNSTFERAYGAKLSNGHYPLRGHHVKHHQSNSDIKEIVDSLPPPSLQL